MKKIQIEIITNEDENKIMTASKFIGYDKGNISDQFEILGILENLVDLQKQKIKLLGRISHG